MRVFKQTIALLLLFLAVVAFYFFYLKPKEEERKRTEEAEKKLVDIEQEKIDEIWIEKATGEKIGFKREGKNRWEIIFPIIADADRFEVNPIASRFSSIEIERLINDQGDFAPYGLEKPRYTVELKTKDGETFVIHIGDKSQVGYSVYARKGDDKRVFLVSAALEAVINKSLDEFRERKPMDFIVSDVKSFYITKYQGGKEQRYIFERNEEDVNEWRILFPDTTTFVPADDSKVRDILYKISGIRIKEFVSDATQPANLYGLENPDMRIDVITKEDKFSLLLKFSGTNIYAKKPDKPNIFTLIEVDQNIRNLTAENIRNKKVLKFYVWRVKEISVETPERAKIIQRDPVNTEKWYLVEGDEKKELDNSKVKELLGRLSDTSVLKFLGDNVDVSEFVKQPKYRVRIDVEGKAEPYYLLIGEKKEIDGLSGVIGGLMDQKSVYLFPQDITSTIQKILEIQPVSEEKSE